MKFSLDGEFCLHTNWIQICIESKISVVFHKNKNSANLEQSSFENFKKVFRQVSSQWKEVYIKIFWKKKRGTAKSMKNQESSGDFNDHQEAQKRKWPYGETDSSYNNNGGVNYSDKSVVVTAAKKCMTTYSAYENYQLNPQYILSECTSNNGQEQQIVEQSDATMTTATQATATSSAESVTVVASAMTPTAAATVSTTTISNCNSNCNQSSSIHMLNAMEIEENIEYVNILYEDDLLTSIQAPVATESHYINFEPPNWSNADILDLDQRNYYYEVNNLNGQMSHHNGHEATIQIQQHHQSQIGQNEIQQHPIEVVPNISHSHVNNSNSNDIHNVADYEVIQNTSYPEAENGREKSVSNLRK